MINTSPARLESLAGKPHVLSTHRQSLFTGQTFPRQGSLSNRHRRISHPTVSIGQASLPRQKHSAGTRLNHSAKATIVN